MLSTNIAALETLANNLRAASAPSRDLDYQIARDYFAHGAKDLQSLEIHHARGLIPCFTSDVMQALRMRSSEWELSMSILGSSVWCRVVEPAPAAGLSAEVELEQPLTAARQYLALCVCTAAVEMRIKILRQRAG